MNRFSETGPVGLARLRFECTILVTDSSLVGGRHRFSTEIVEVKNLGFNFN